MITVCYSANRGYFKGLSLAVMSLIDTTNEALDINILTMDVSDDNPKFLPMSDEQIALLDKLAKEKNPESRVIKVDLTKEYLKYFRYGKNHENGYTPYATLRLLYDLYPDCPDKAIYLDGDTMCVSDIKQLADVDVEGYDFAASKDYMGRFWINRNYCNSGVMLMNMKQIKENGLFDKCRKMVASKKMIMPDQSALNKHGKKKFLPFKFNEQRKIKPDTVVKHFCKGIVFFLPFGFHIYNIKQWQIDKVHKSLKIFCFDHIYEKHAELMKQYPNLF